MLIELDGLSSLIPMALKPDRSIENKYIPLFCQCLKTALATFLAVPKISTYMGEIVWLFGHLFNELPKVLFAVNLVAVSSESLWRGLYVMEKSKQDLILLSVLCG